MAGVDASSIQGPPRSELEEAHGGAPFGLERSCCTGKKTRAPRAEEGTTRKMKQREQARLGGRRGRCARQRKEEERRPWNRTQQEGPMAMELAGKERAQEDKADGHKKNLSTTG
jgi:hypothetical protein